MLQTVIAKVNAAKSGEDLPAIKSAVSDLNQARHRMDWSIVEPRIQLAIQPGHRGMLKCQGLGICAFLSNDGSKIVVRTGVKTIATKSIRYDMIRFAFEIATKTAMFSYADTDWGGQGIA